VVEEVATPVVEEVATPVVEEVATPVVEEVALRPSRNHGDRATGPRHCHRVSTRPSRLRRFSRGACSTSPAPRR